MKKNLLRGLCAGLLLLFSATAPAQTWTGGSSNDWFTAANWNPAVVPNSSSTVTIPGALATYPVLTGNVSIASFTMNSGSMLNLAGFTFTDMGNAAMQGATVSGSGTFNVLNSASVNIQSSTIAATLNVTNYQSNFYFLNNTVTGNSIFSDAAGQNTNANYLDGNLFTGNLGITHNSPFEMDEGYSGITGDHITGNATFTIGGSGTFYSSYSHGLQVDGNLTVTRTVPGNTYLFPNTGTVTGNFSFTTSSGTNVLGNANGQTTHIGGTINISAPVGGSFELYRIRNAVAGGTISCNAASNVNVQNDTLLSTFSLTNYSSNFTLFNNSITGNSTISSSSAQNTNANYMDGNLFTGNLTCTHASSFEFDEGYGTLTKDIVTGNASFTVSGSGNFYCSYSHGIQVGGSFTFNRTVAGLTSLFNTAGTIGGNFSYSSSGGSNTIGNQSTLTTTIGGTLNITAVSPATFYLYRMKNSVAGGAISVSSPTNVDIRNDTLKATTSVTNYSSNFSVFSNSFTGDATFTNTAAQNTSSNYINANLFTGNLSITHNSSFELDEGYGGGLSGDHITGNVTINIGGTGNFYLSTNYPTQVGGNLQISRTVGGNTILFSTPGAVAGNMSLSTSAGNTTISNTTNGATGIGGTLNITAINPSSFNMYKLKNVLPGGTISITSPNDALMQFDTVVATLNITGYTGNFHLFNSSVTGNTTLSNTNIQNTSNNYVDGNLFTGNLSLTHNSTFEMDEGYGVSAPNHVTGNASFTIGGTGAFYSSSSHPLQVDGSLSITRTVAGNTFIFNNGGAVAGNFTLNTTGDNTVGNAGLGTVHIGGTMAVNATNPSSFNMYRIMNGVAGGSVMILNPTSISIQNDTLLANLTVTNYAGNFIVYNNQITGNSLFTDIPSQSTSNANMSGNRFVGNRGLVHSSTFPFYEGYGTGTANVVTGTDSLVASGSGALNVGYSQTTQELGDLVINSSSLNSIAINALDFTGNANSHIRQRGSQPVAITTLYMDKISPARLFPDTNITVTGVLQFNTGIIVTTATRSILFGNNANASGASNSSHIMGPVAKAGNQAFTFPVGTGAVLANIGISAPATTTDTIAAAFYYSNPALAGYDTSAAHRAPTLQKVSGCEYWDLTHVSGTSAVAVTLQYGVPCNGVTTPSALRVAHYNGSIWDDLGNGGTTGSSSQGIITSASTISSFSPFTLATINAALNPLPIDISDFTASRTNSAVLLEWTVQSEKENRGFDIQRSGNGSLWTNIGYVASAGNSSVAHTYNYTDAAPLAGKSYYRLRVQDYSGHESYSDVRMVQMDGNSGGIAVYPNPTAGLLHISGDAAVVTISDATGKIVHTDTGAGDVRMQSMPPGMYMVRVIQDNGTVHTFKVIKE